ncbi:MAG: SdpI family protein [Clostridia bacterium]|nr:SdpI family protein [Clostridia bacterium]
MKEKLIKYKWRLLISSVLILLPSLFGLILWNELPEKIAVHWGPSGEADGWGSPLFAVIGFPLILLAVHWLCMIITFCDKKQEGQSRKAFEMIFWIMPVISIFVSGIMYASALDVGMNTFAYVCILLGAVFIVIGNYLPKCKQNRTLGIKLRWTLANEENWNKTHRLGGKIGVVCGVLTLLTAFLPSIVFPFVAIGLILANVIIPTVYSYRLYRKHLHEGVVYTFEKHSKTRTLLMVILIVSVVVLCLITLFTGDINTTVGEDTLTIDAPYRSGTTIQYDKIERLELVESFDAGERVNGFGTPKLSLGWFKNDAFGTYTLYGYTKSDVCTVLVSDGKTIAVALESAEQTRALYEALKGKVK